MENTLGVESDFYLTARHEIFMIKTQLLVSVVDDDESVRESLPDLLKELGFAVRVFPSAEAFLASDSVTETKCLLLDIAMPGLSGPELYRELVRRGLTMPVVFITARRDENMRSRMLESGAVECLFKPFSDTALLEALNKAVLDQ
jgi:FixJ family two-component response regulator